MVLANAVILLLITAAASVIGLDYALAWGLAGYFALSGTLKNLISRDHRKGIQLIKEERFSEAMHCFEDSYSFYSRNPWVDRFRAITTLSISEMCYREMALMNIAFCLSVTGEQEKAIAEYQRLLGQFPNNKMAEYSLRVLKPKGEIPQSSEREG